MKNFLYSLLLCMTFVIPAWCAADTAAAANDDPDEKLQIDRDSDEPGDTGMTERQLEQRIKGKVFSLIADIVDAADDGMSETEKIEIKKEIEDAIEDVKNIKKQEDDVDFKHRISIGSADEPLYEEAILGAMAIFFIFGTPIMIIAAVLYTSYRKKRLMHETIDGYVASGKDIPPEVLQGLQKETSPKSNLHRGLVMSGIGLGIFACFALIGTLEAAAFGLIPLFIGLAQLLIWKLENK